MTVVTSRVLETLLQLACFHYLTADQVEAFLLDGSALLPSSGRRLPGGSSPAASALASSPRPPGPSRPEASDRRGGLRTHQHRRGRPAPSTSCGRRPQVTAASRSS